MVEVFISSKFISVPYTGYMRARRAKADAACEFSYVFIICWARSGWCASIASALHLHLIYPLLCYKVLSRQYLQGSVVSATVMAFLD